nr:MAG TPA: hypothetical protein [Caudoviricetes sp.]
MYTYSPIVSGLTEKYCKYELSVCSTALPLQ